MVTRSGSATAIERNSFRFDLNFKTRQAQHIGGLRAVEQGRSPLKLADFVRHDTLARGFQYLPAEIPHVYSFKGKFPGCAPEGISKQLHALAEKIGSGGGALEEVEASLKDMQARMPGTEIYLDERAGILVEQALTDDIIGEALRSEFRDLFGQLGLRKSAFATALLAAQDAPGLLFVAPEKLRSPLFEFSQGVASDLALIGGVKTRYKFSVDPHTLDAESYEKHGTKNDLLGNLFSLDGLVTLLQICRGELRIDPFKVKTADLSLKWQTEFMDPSRPRYTGAPRFTRSEPAQNESGMKVWRYWHNREVLLSLIVEGKKSEVPVPNPPYPLDAVW